MINISDNEIANILENTIHERMVFFMRVSVTNKCTGCGICSTLSPEVFEIYRNFAIANPDKICGREESCIDAAINCPANAINIDD